MVDGLYIIEDFYNDPYEVRSLALASEFKVRGNYPGLRTDARDKEHREYLKGFFEKILNTDITFFEGGYNTAFQYTTEEDDTWIHHDDTDWAGVIYLTPDAPIESGTSIYRHKETKTLMWDGVNNSPTDFNQTNFLKDLTKWEKVVNIGNVFNRLILYKGAYYHRSELPGFGQNQYDGRLFQTFFFS